MLAYRYRNKWVEWRRGTRLPPKLGGVTPPPNAETLLSDEELAALHLVRVQDRREPPPPNMADDAVVRDWALVDHDGVPVRVPVWQRAKRSEPAPPDPLLERIEALEKAVAEIKQALRG